MGKDGKQTQKNKIKNTHPNIRREREGGEGRGREEGRE
jgi:hypothetical protein